jgi:16S rRNA (adenine1518-N6/adenine1519-N6)-dimethyltransferase
VRPGAAFGPAEVDLATPAGVRAALAAAGLRLRPSRGQHFLINRRVLDRIIQAAKVGPSDVVLEVGAGIGTLTVALARTGAAVLAVEVDPRFIPVLRAACAPHRRVRVIHADAMELPLASLPEAPTAVVANPPYSIASPLVIRLLDEGVGRRMTVMVQDEVASRIVARPGGKAYGLLSVAVQSQARPEIVMRVPRSAFFPPPRVRSAVVTLDRNERPILPAAQMSVLRAVARAAFGQRRKMLRSALRRLDGTEVSPEAVEAWCRAAGVDPRRRGENLSVAEFAGLARVFVEGGIEGRGRPP